MIEPINKVIMWHKSKDWEGIMQLANKINEIISVVNSGAVGGEKCKHGHTIDWHPDCFPKDKPVDTAGMATVGWKDKPSKGLEDVIYCNIPCNYDGTNPKEVEMTMEKVAWAIRKWIAERLPKEHRFADRLQWEQGYNDCLTDVKKSLGVE